MLETIFELLKSWTDVNLKNFWLQLKQFFEVYSKPFVYEEKQKRWLSLDYGEDNVKNMLKELMVHGLLPQQEHGGLVYGLDPLRAAVVMWSVCQGYSIGLKDTECFRLCAALCLPQMTKEDFTNYWADFSREVPFLRGLSEKLASLINAVKKTGNPNWILVLPLRHILNGTIKPFEEPDPVKIKYGPNWAGLEGLEVGTSRNMNSQQKHCFTGAYRQSCLTMIVKLLDKLCKGVKPESYTQNYPDVPLICMNILALVTDFVHRNAPKSPEGKAEQQNVNDCVSQAKSIIRNWMARSFKQNLLSKGFFSSASADVEESARKQIEYYCSGIESLENSAPCVAAIIEMCALEAVPSLCQNKNEGQILERIKVNWKFVGLISAIIEKSWPS
ncbi:hypothetical protein fugu_015382 [Takifugu bimaculatus]|uniref:Uncharacterized protein n=1 Tax=Takifugu bimaculatus TaxID=433685 RepID=A0A4Z2C0A8_9TELE|nr:hypothetical protein fugu_015382 [Takifugu bimaculatus]